jgi:hypothetical protein
LEEQFSLNALRTVRLPVEQIYCRHEAIDRIAIGRALRCLLARPPQIFDCPRNVIAAAVMMR